MVFSGFIHRHPNIILFEHPQDKQRTRYPKSKRRINHKHILWETDTTGTYRLEFRMSGEDGDWIVLLIPSGATTNPKGQD